MEKRINLKIISYVIINAISPAKLAVTSNNGRIHDTE
jgi:hypothetical protein